MTNDEYTALVAETEGLGPNWTAHMPIEDRGEGYDDGGAVECGPDMLLEFVGDMTHANQIIRLAAAAPALLAEVGRLREALAKYADPGIYAPHPHGPAFDDRDLSWIARAALRGEAP